MTLNQVIRRLKTICLAHNQVRNFAFGMVQEFLNDKTTKYPSVFVQDSAGQISVQGRFISFNFRMFFVDLVHVASDTKANELDVQSDMISIAADIVTQINNGNFTDWKISSDNSINLVYEEEGDMYAGVVMDITLSIQYSQNVCEIPTDLDDYTPTDTDMKLVFDEKYVATGTEGSTLTIPALLGKKVLLVIRENNPLHKVSNLPDPAEYTWDNTNLGLGTVINPGERFLILYRNY